MREAFVGVSVAGPLIASEEEELVVNDGAAYGSAGDVAVEVGVDFVGGDVVRGLLVEERRGVEPVGSADSVDLAVPLVGAGAGVDVDLRSAGVSLLGVVRGGVDANLLDEFGRRRSETLAVGSGDGDVGLVFAADVVVGSFADVEVVALGGGLGGGFAVEEVGDVDSVDLEHVAGVALTVGPDGRVAESGVGTDAVLEFCADAGSEHGETREAAGRERSLLNLGGVEDVTVSAVDGVSMGRSTTSTVVLALPTLRVMLMVPVRSSWTGIVGTLKVSKPSREKVRV